MSTENKNSFDWVWYVIGILTGILSILSFSSNFGLILLGGIMGLIGTAIFVNGIVKGREY